MEINAWTLFSFLCPLPILLLAYICKTFSTCHILANVWSSKQSNSWLTSLIKFSSHQQLFHSWCSITEIKANGCGLWRRVTALGKSSDVSCSSHSLVMWKASSRFVHTFSLSFFLQKTRELHPQSCWRFDHVLHFSHRIYSVRNAWGLHKCHWNCILEIPSSRDGWLNFIFCAAWEWWWENAHRQPAS